MRFGKYELGALIARGGMAEVWSARMHGAEGFVKPVAIKRIREQISQTPEFVSLFIAEARLVAQLHHANIVQIYDFDLAEGAYYLAMELVAGRDLRRVLSRAAEAGKRLGPELGIHIAQEVAKGLMAAHEQCDSFGRPLRIVHRDLSPHNILLSFAGEVKVTDFGIAKAMAASLGPGTGVGMVRGKLAYMAPEQARGEEVDQRSDLFALGLVLFEIATGRRRYSEAGELGLFRVVSEAARPNPAELNAAISPELNEIIRRLLAPSPAARFSSARELLGALSGLGDSRDRSLELASLMREIFPEEAEASRRLAGLSAEPAEVGQAEEPPETIEGASSSSGQVAGLVASDSPLSVVGRRRLWRGLAGVAVLLAALGGLFSLVKDYFRARAPGARGAPVEESFIDSGQGAERLPVEKPATAPRPDTGAGAIEIRSEPPGAVVVVDGLPTGTRTPARLGVTPGRHSVLVRWGDGVEVLEEREVRARERLTLLLTRPAGRELVAIRMQMGASASPHAVGSDRVAMKPGTGREVASMRASPSETPTAAADLAKAERVVLFTCKPWAMVSIGGEDIGQTPVKRSLEPGKYRAVFSNPSLGLTKPINLKVVSGTGQLHVDCALVDLAR
ncbi:MAG: serine/threonine-protein kinase, partial [Polyangia bacterium]|nr:serine/threonine-protein kinase [Polyangia bacterium]